MNQPKMCFSNHKWNKWVSTITSLRLDLLLRVHQPYLCLLYVWVQKQVTKRSREITYGLDQIAVVKYLGKSSLSPPISLSKEDRRRKWESHSIWKAWVDQTGWNEEHQKSPRRKWRSCPYAGPSSPTLAGEGCFYSPPIRRCQAL